MTTKLKDTILIGGQPIEIHKLKAGKFYELQKMFAETVTMMYAGTEDSETERLRKIISEFPEKTSELVAFCAGIEVSKIHEDAYPEEIPPAFEKCLKLNNVLENIKNYTAPMENMTQVMEK